MNTSPLEFAKKFSKLKSDLNSQLSDDNRLLLIQTFWKEHLSLLNDKSYQSYFDEFKELFSLYIKEDSITDLTIEELKNLLELSQSINLSDASKIIVTRLVKLLCYVGELKNALTACQDITGKDIDPSEIPEDLFKQAGIEPLRAICHHLKRLNSKSLEIFQSVLINWEGLSASLHNNKAVALFVEKDSNGSALRGRMRILKGTVDLRKSIRNDELTFDTQLKAPNDPFVGVVYNSFKAVRNVFKSAGYKKQSSNYYHAHYVIENSSHTFTGDSIGLAAGLVAYTQLLKPEVVRHERFLSGEVAYTGGVDDNGKLTPVNNETLGSKIERVFFSPVKYLVLPESNAVAAREHLDKLSKQYPHRRLHLVPAECISDVIENLNIVRAEKVCPGKVAIKIVTKYSRMTKVQVPLLLALLYLFICIMYPKAWIGFDWNPQKIGITPEKVTARNINNHFLWDLEINDLVSYEIDITSTSAILNDMDSDGKNEVLLLLSPKDFISDSSCCALLKLSFEGNISWDTMFCENPVIGDIKQPNFYRFGVRPPWSSLISLQQGDSTKLVLIMAKQHAEMSFSQIICFDPVNNVVTGDYWHRGILTDWVVYDLFNDSIDDLLFTAISNEHNCAAFFTFISDSLSGLMPPYFDKGGNKGSQIFYLLFPKSFIAKIEQSEMQQADIRNFDSEHIELLTSESKDGSGLLYSFDENIRVLLIIPSDTYITGLNDYWNEHQYLDSTLLFRIPSKNELKYFNGKEFVNYWTTCFPYLKD